MIKISTLYEKDPSDLGSVLRVVDPKNRWVLNAEGVATRKFDGTATAIIEGELYKRFDLKPGRTLPPNAIPCQDEPDKIGKHHPHWVKCERTDKASKWHFQAFDKLVDKADGTYELCGEKVQSNPEGIDGHELIKHGEEILTVKLNFDSIKEYLSTHDIEGIVFHHKTDGRMCKIRKSDFGIKRIVK